MKSNGGSTIEARVSTIALALVLALATGACSHKSPVAADDGGGGGGEPETFFNWLPAYLQDQQAPEAQLNHEIMEWMDDPANFPRQDRVAELQAILDRLGDAPDRYRANAPGYTAFDEPILDAIEEQILQGHAYLNGQLQFNPLLQRTGG